MKTFAEYYEMYRNARDFDTERFSNYIELMAFYEGKQALLSSYSGDKPWVIDINTPYATDAINTRVASLVASDYVGEILPLSPYDVDGVEKVNQGYRSMWKELNMDKHVNESIQRSAVIREAYTHIVYNDEVVYGGTNTQRPGKLEAYFIDPAAVYIDPNALSLKDADYVVIVERITPQAATDKYKKFNPGESRSSMFTAQDRGEEWTGTDFSAQQEDILTKLTFYEVENKGTSSQVIFKTVFIENQMVLKTTQLPIKYLPIAQLRWEKKMKSPYGISLMDRLLPLQKTVNALESASTNTALSFAVPSFIVSKDSGLDPMDVARTAGAPGMVYPVEGAIDGAIRPLMEGKILDQEMMVMKQQMQNTIYEIAGVTSQFIGDLGTAGNTTGGAAQAISRAKIVEQLFMVNIEEYIEDLSRIVVDFLVKVFAGEKIYSRQELKNGPTRYRFQEIEVPPFADSLEFDFYIELNSRTKFNKDINRELMLQLYQFERQYDAPVKVITALDVIKSYEIPNQDEIIERYHRMTTQDNQKKSELITELTAKGMQYGIDQGMIQQAITEILEGKETPTLDMILQQIQQIQQAMIQQQQQAMEQSMGGQLPPDVSMGNQMQQIMAQQPQPGGQPGVGMQPEMMQ